MINKKRCKSFVYILGLVMVLGSEFIVRDIFLPIPANDMHIGIAVLIEWIILLVLLVFWIPKVEGNKLESIGFGDFKLRYLWISILTYLMLMFVWAGSSFILKAIALEGLKSLQPMIREYNPIILVSLFFTGTFLEEVFYRGYLIERLTSLTGQKWLSGIASCLAFTFVHLKFFGLGPTLDVSILSAALVILYLKEKSIWPCILVHGINDAFGFLIFPLLIQL